LRREALKFSPPPREAGKRPDSIVPSITSATSDGQCVKRDEGSVPPKRALLLATKDFNAGLLHSDGRLPVKRLS
jgi:hypothetical protein